MRLPSPAMVVACVALVVALSGTGYAAVKLTKNSVGATQIRPAAVRSSEVKDRSLRARDFARGQLPRGATGPAAPSGPGCSSDASARRCDAGRAVGLGAGARPDHRGVRHRDDPQRRDVLRAAGGA